MQTHTQLPAKIANELELIFQYRRKFDCYFEVEKYKSYLYVHTDLPLNCEIFCENIQNRFEIYALLIEVAEVFDFSYNLDFSSKQEIKEFLETFKN